MNYEERQRRLDRARFAIQAELLIGLMFVILTGFFSIMASPWGSDPIFHVPPLIQLLVLGAPVASLLAWVWMCDSHDRDPRRASGLGDTATVQRSDGH